tara:strand:+ start:244 stop:429 length:186 start_codon:yes stop_codon:yes gene_type:complete
MIGMTGIKSSNYETAIAKVHDTFYVSDKEALQAAKQQGFFDGFRYDVNQKIWIRCDGEDRD